METIYCMVKVRRHQKTMQMQAWVLALLWVVASSDCRDSDKSERQFDQKRRRRDLTGSSASNKYQMVGRVTRRRGRPTARCATLVSAFFFHGLDRSIEIDDVAILCRVHKLRPSKICETSWMNFPCPRIYFHVYNRKSKLGRKVRT